jgi:hypothetical protein
MLIDMLAERVPDAVWKNDRPLPEQVQLQLRL